MTNRYFTFQLNWPIIAQLILIMFLINACQQMNTKNTLPDPPDAKKIPKELSIHGDKRIDHYFWLNDREDPEVIKYLEAENEYTKAALADTEEFQEELYQEIIGRIKQEDESVPFKENVYYYYTRYEEGKEYPIFCRKKGSMDNEEEIMIDANKMAAGYDYFNIGGVNVSPDNKLLAFGVDTVSRRKYTIHVKNLNTGEIIESQINNTTGSVAWSNDNQTFFYTLKDEETLRPYQIRKHRLNEDVSRDKVVFTEQDETFNTYVFKTKSKQYILIGSFSTLSHEYRYIDAGKPDENFHVFLPREREHEYHIDHYDDHFYILTNWKAKNFRLMKTKISSNGKENWEEVIPHREDIYLSDFDIFQDYLVITERKNGINALRIINWTSDEEHFVEFDEEVYEVYTGKNPEFDTEKLRFHYSSLTTPNSVYDYHMTTRQRELKKRQEVLGPFDPDNYEAKRLYALTSDSAKVPVSLVYRKGIQLNGENPTVLYGYGSYGYTIDPYFSSVRLSLLDRGFVFAIAHVRGGQIKGRSWYEDGKLLKKKNTFYDFIACAEHLIDEGYTSPDKLCAMGGSAGGLLMGAVVNMRPDLFNAVVAAVPFVDVVTTMLDKDIPLTTSEYDEWGNPNEKDYYEYILSYSPYDNVSNQQYPNLLVTTGLHDSQVQYWEPAKWVAKMRDHKTGDNLLLLYTNMGAGHSGKSGRFRRYKETAMEYAFFMKTLGMI